MPATAPRAMSPALVALVALGLSGCATGAMSTAARDTMARASGCPADQVKVEELGGSRYKASGCEKTEMYICKVAEHAVVSCVPESSVPPLGEQAK